MFRNRIHRLLRVKFCDKWQELWDCSTWFRLVRVGIFFVVVMSCLVVEITQAAEPELRRRADEALSRAVRFFVEEVSTEGGFLWQYSDDLSRREGEGKAPATTVWVQPPGTPSVGMAFLRAYERTGKSSYLNAATNAADCLVRGQLRSGGWQYRIDFEPDRRRRTAYRVDEGKDGSHGRNTSTLDDNTTQAALRLLMRLDQTLEFKDVKIHEAAEYGLNALVRAQYPNGAWPQRFDAFPDPEQFPVRKASYPETWSRTFPGRHYGGFYTFNDNALGDVIEVMFEAAKIYDNAGYRESAERAGRFILAAQMPEPQPAWAQQYDAAMHPAWARKFEPPSITGGESQGVMRTLMHVYRQTGDKKFLEPLPRAIAYFRRSELADGRLARFYELRTNEPLYFTKDYQLTDSDAEMPTHYAFKVSNRIDAIEREYEKLLALDPAKLLPETSTSTRRATKSQIERAVQAIETLDARGRWVEDGSLKYQTADDSTHRVIDCRTFIQNVDALSEYLSTVE